MGAPKSKLTEWPEDLKDVIDWFLRVGEMDQGGSGQSNSGKLKNAVESLRDFKPVTQPLGTFHIEGPFDSVTKALQHLIGYDGTYQLQGNGIGRSPGYTSSYSNQAKWEGKLDDPNSEEAKKAAILLVCYMPVLYLCIIYLYWKCSNSGHGGWGSETINGNHSGLNIFMVNMGFETNELQAKSGSEIANLLVDARNGLDELKYASQRPYSYSGFLENIKNYREQKLKSSPVSCSLYTLYCASTKYLKSRHKEDQGNTEPFNKIKNLYESVKSACIYSDQDLKDAIHNFLIEIGASKPASLVSDADSTTRTSPAGPVAGTLTTLGIGGGAAAAYLFNLGGAKTLVNGILKIG
ncbi:variant erythrocyte surface antigen-1 family protein [Babesia caballi]|uniref:Variant erythrocyte surface antigen-1 family protein n=1 Tax=Babesia caballi TaxID=5871 RepID=A0AAV4LW33_BABCB|nr:variant erythrocyte surface antigen-1 family protein [Babesia caballi]